MKRLLVVLMLSGCGYDSDCADGCDKEQPPERGEVGATGAAGKDGADGQGCELSAGEEDAVLTCGGVSFTIKSGRQGIQGLPGEVGPSGPIGPAGPSGAPGQDGADSVTEIIDPCGKQRSDSFDEVLIRLANGKLLAVYYAPGKTAMVVVGPGFYSTTDGTGCSFAVDANGLVTWNEGDL